MESHHLNAEFLKKYSRQGPRYTSYPTAPVFTPEFTEQNYLKLLHDSSRKNIPLSLYFHIPYCQSVCSFCACSVIYTKNREHVDPYLALVEKEMSLVKKELDSSRLVDQLHWGGGTPTFLTPDRMARFFSSIKDNFNFTPSPEVSIELDPREVTDEHIDTLKRLGFNRASLGIQDFDIVVQEAVNRVQSLDITEHVYFKLRESGFSGINFDLIYGLPHQTKLTFKKTIDAVIRLKPDRISLFNFAYLPWLKTHQKRIKESELPATDTKLEIFASAVEKFTDAGYVYIGMDHFALPEDELHVSQTRGTLHRNFQGYTTRGGCDLIGFGLTSIGELSDGYTQNHKDMDVYRQRLSENRLPTERGLNLTFDDRLRRRVIMELLNHFRIEPAKIENEYSINFDEYFSKELDGLTPFMDDGLLLKSERDYRVTWQGKFVIRNMCMLFDAYLETLAQKGQRFSKTV